MRNKELSNSPQNVTDYDWYYEENKGILLVHEVCYAGKHVQTDDVLIPWKMLKESLARYEKGKKKQSRPSKSRKL